MATFDDFQKVDIRVGKVLEAKPLEGVRITAYQMKVDFGPEIGIKQTAAQITDHYEPEDLIGRQVLGVVNFPPKKIGEFSSEFLTLGVVDKDDKVILIGMDKEAPLGSKLC